MKTTKKKSKNHQKRLSVKNVAFLSAMKGLMQMRPIKCNKDCRQCNKYGSAKTDDKGYPFEYECFKHNEIN